MRKFFKENGLALASFGLFFFFWAAMAIAGYSDYNQQQQEYGRAASSFLSYLGTGHFWEATFENWESEYLQMGLFVLLTAFLFQKGSAESKTREQHEKEEQEEEQEEYSANNEAPSPVHRGGWILKLYENSLSIALLSIFLLCFILHAIHGTREYNLEQSYLHQKSITVWGFLGTSDFWFQSFQNWQSEFLAVGSIIVLTIYLRQKGSAESKRVGAPSSETGGES